jgi:cyclase
MLRVRVMPCLLLRNSKLVKTVRFKDPDYIGDPVNAVKIYNDKEVDELIFLDITATVEEKQPNFKTIGEIASECFMPMTYGGGIRSTDDMRRIYNLGVEKIAINSYAVENPDIIRKASGIFGSQSVLVAIDVKKRLMGGYEVFTQSAKKGYDTELIGKVATSVSIPIIACGGAGRIEDFALAVEAGASACAAGSMVVYQGKGRGVLINFPSQKETRAILP